MKAHSVMAFVGGGNMAGAIVAGLVRGGHPPAQLVVVEPSDAARDALVARLGVRALAQAEPALGEADLVVWAVKPQVFAAAAAPVAPYTGSALHVSVMAGIRCAALTAATGSARVVRAMPNTPALIGQGMTGLYAPPVVDAGDRARAEALLSATGQVRWVASEGLMDAVTAISGSGPAYAFYLMEAMIQAAQDLGLDADAARQLTVQTVAGAAALAAQSDDPVAWLRARVTSPGGTTAAAVAVLEQRGVDAAVRDAARAAARRAQELSG